MAATLRAAICGDGGSDDVFRMSRSDFFELAFGMSLGLLLMVAFIVPVYLRESRHRGRQPREDDKQIDSRGSRDPEMETRHISPSSRTRRPNGEQDGEESHNFAHFGPSSSKTNAGSAETISGGCGGTRHPPGSSISLRIAIGGSGGSTTEMTHFQSDPNVDMDAAASGALIDDFKGLIEKQAHAARASGADRDDASPTTQPAGGCEAGSSTLDHDNDARGIEERSGDGAADVARFERYLRRHLPQAVSERLGESHPAMNETPEGERERLVRIVRDAQNQVMRSFHSRVRLDSGPERAHVHGSREDER
ncbi:hypothetical protein CTA2_7648 [Colletotrichum tanaceti]|nr:hypothetical protein CTA2_7648 [Colletotrichum tanaceti]